MDLVRQAYGEVLDATKHQDEKVGRFLTAIAFLTTGAVALLFRTDLITTEFRFAGPTPSTGSYPLLAWAALGFFVSVVGAVALLLLTLSTPLRIPGKRLQWGDRLDGSRLFFSYIGEEPADKWLSRWLAPPAEEIRSEMVRQYALETHNLAERARQKYRHTKEAASLFVLSLLFLASAMLLAISASIGALGEGVHVVPYEWPLSWGLGLIAAVHVGLQLYARVVQDLSSFQLVRDATHYGKGSEADQTMAAARSTRWLLLTVPAYVIAVTAPGAAPLWRGIGAVAAIAALIGTLVATLARWREDSKLEKAFRIALYGVVPAVVALDVLYFGGVWQLAGMLLTPLSLFLANVYESHRRDRVAHKKIREAAAPAQSAAPPGGGA